MDCGTHKNTLILRFQFLLVLSREKKTEEGGGGGGVPGVHVVTVVLISRNNVEAAKLLVDAGADVNARDLKGGPPIEMAAALGNRQVLEVLVKAPSADVNAQVSC